MFLWRHPTELYARGPDGHVHLALKTELFHIATSDDKVGIIKTLGFQYEFVPERLLPGILSCQRKTESFLWHLK